ncbi:MAG: tRNA pseudouridine(38-40) synthase TruA [Acidobacteria bacterium]|nr:tRNA pseudouridine(38-40) synthase TruA [Acidobacteriota bacterium]
MSRVLKLTVSYDGTAYVGWQRQSRGVSIQGLIEEALGRLAGAPVAIAGAGRTDAGVHALGQVVSAPVTTGLDTHTIRRALNATLPRDIRVVRVEDAAPGFHARYSASVKMYEYRLWDGDVQPPLARAWSWHGPRGLDVQVMNRAACALEGTHDFGAFQGSRSSVKTTIRTVTLAQVVDEAVPPGAATVPLLSGEETTPARLIVFRIEADGFLRHMVRAMVGTLVEVGLRRREAAAMTRLLDSGDRSDAGPTAPANGLVLVRVRYLTPG